MISFNKLLISTFTISILFCGFAYSQGITIKSGFTISSDDHVILKPSVWNNEADYDNLNVGISFDFTNLTSFTDSKDTIFVKRIIGNNKRVTLNNFFHVQDSVVIGDFGFNLDGCSILLGVDAKLIESLYCYHHSTSNGAFQHDYNYATLNNTDIGGLGLTVTTTKQVSNLKIKRLHSILSSNGNESIRRYYLIEMFQDSELDATIKIKYVDDELNGINENDLCIYSSMDNGTTWHAMGGTVDENNKTIEVSGVDSLKLLTVGSNSNPLPVELTSFYASNTNEGTLLNWETATEVNNYGFEVERSIVGTGHDLSEPDTIATIEEWRKIAFVPGHGNSNSPKSYEFLDQDFDHDEELIIKYRLKQIDTDGSFYIYNQVAETSSSITGVENLETKEELPTEFALHQNYPNPFNPNTTIIYEVPVTASNSQFSIDNSQLITLVIYDILGNEVSQLVNQHQKPGNYIVEFNASSLTSGTYFYRLTAGSFTTSRKMLLIK